MMFHVPRGVSYMAAFMLLAAFSIGANAGVVADTRQDAKITDLVNKEDIRTTEGGLSENARPFYYQHLPDQLTPQPDENSAVMEILVIPSVMFALQFAEVIALFFFDNRGWLPVAVINYALQAAGYLLVGVVVLFEGRRALRLSREVGN